MKKDHCTFAPEMDVGETCCGHHDKAYSRGGDKVDRLNADIQLRDCIRAHGHPIVCWAYYIGVRLFGWIRFNWK